MPTGTIKFFNGQKGFGFIVSDEGSKEIFLPTATLSGIDTAKLKPGQRVSFEIETEARGPKAVGLKLLERAPPPPAPVRVQAPADKTISLFYDPAADDSEEVLDALRAPDRPLREVDIITSAPTPQDLKKWSLLMGNSGKGLVRRFHPMFHALQLDDRFIGQDEFWTAVSEHPVLIETPLLVSRDRVSICKSAEDVHAFLRPAIAPEPPRAKGLSPRLAAMIRGEAVPEAPMPEPEKPAAPASIKPPTPAPIEPAEDAAPVIKKTAAKPIKLSVTKARPAPATPKAEAPKKAAARPAPKAPAKKAAPAAKPKKPTGRR